MIYALLFVAGLFLGVYAGVVRYNALVKKITPPKVEMISSLGITLHNAQIRPHPVIPQPVIQADDVALNKRTLAIQGLAALINLMNSTTAETATKKITDARDDALVLLVQSLDALADLSDRCTCATLQYIVKERPGATESLKQAGGIIATQIRYMEYAKNTAQTPEATPQPPIPEPPSLGPQKPVDSVLMPEMPTQVQ